MDIVLRDPMFGRVALALDGDPGAVAVLRHQVDADVLPAQAGQALAFRPIGPAPDAVEFELRLVAGEAGEQVLEPLALLNVGTARLADALQPFAGGEGDAQVEGGLGREVSEWSVHVAKLGAAVDR